MWVLEVQALFLLLVCFFHRAISPIFLSPCSYLTTWLVPNLCCTSGAQRSFIGRCQKHCSGLQQLASILVTVDSKLKANIFNLQFVVTLRSSSYLVDMCVYLESWILLSVLLLYKYNWTSHDSLGLTFLFGYVRIGKRAGVRAAALNVLLRAFSKYFRF